MKDIEEGARQLVVACGDGTLYFQMPDRALDTIALSVQPLVPADGGFARSFGRDAGPDADLFEFVPDGVRVVALVSEKIARRLIRKRHHVFECRTVGGFAGRETEDERDALGITETMNFTGEPAPRPAKSLFASPPFAPAAET